jgi:hypothetical protein
VRQLTGRIIQLKRKFILSPTSHKLHRMRGLQRNPPSQTPKRLFTQFRTVNSIHPTSHQCHSEAVCRLDVLFCAILRMEMLQILNHRFATYRTTLVFGSFGLGKLGIKTHKKGYKRRTSRWAGGCFWRFPFHEVFWNVPEYILSTVCGETLGSLYYLSYPVLGLVSHTLDGVNSRIVVVGGPLTT